MSTNSTSALTWPKTNRRQFSLDFVEDPDAELGLDVEQDLDIEQSACREQSSVCHECLDVLCLQTACAGVLLALWCELTNYARTYGVPKDALRAMVECSFLRELDRGLFFMEFEEEPKPLTRVQYVKALERAKRIEEARWQNAKYPYKVPDDQWGELLAKAEASRQESIPK